MYTDFGPTLLAEHLSRGRDGQAVKAPTLRLWMIDEGLWEAKRRKARHRKARPRRAAFGELIQWGQFRARVVREADVGEVRADQDA